MLKIQPYFVLGVPTCQVSSTQVEASNNSVMALVKVGFLALRTVAKPLTKAFGQRCETNERFRRTCIGMAEAQQIWTARLNHALSRPTGRRGSPRRRLFRPPRALAEDEAVKLGSTIMVELSAMGVAVACIGGDQLLSRHKKRAEKAEKAELYHRLQKLEEQHAAVEQQLASQLAMLSHSVAPPAVVQDPPSKSVRGAWLARVSS